MQAPPAVPEKGFYYHYKHDASKPVNDYAYEVVGVGMHTEDDCRAEDAHMVVYRPLYEARVWKMGRFFDLRPLQMWMGDVTKDGKTFPRFRRIVDPAVITLLEEIKNTMYQSS